MTTEAEGGQERWQRICAILDAVFDAPDSERRRILAEHCAGDAGLRAEVEAMLAAEAATDRRVDAPIAEWAGDMLGDAEPVQAHEPGEMIGDYRLMRELGRGGMGAVWLAERSRAEFRQQVALKLLKRGLDTDAVLRRFYEERRILARLRHPHIALFIDGGVSDSGQPWFTMEWVDGAPITQWCDARKQGVRERVALFLDAVAAVQYAHQQLIVHRDLKPGNVLVSESGEVKLLDFGIAKMLDETEGSAQAATMTRMGVRMLTPGYAAPEQMRGDPATTATDVYALGVLLGELLTGKRPASKSRDATDAPVQRPSSQVDDAAAALRGIGAERLRRQLRGDLDTIVLKALSSEPARRYGSAQAFGEDLQRWLDGQPVQARPDSAWYRARRFIGRHRLGTAATAVMVLSLATGALVAGWQAREASHQAQEARRQTLEARRQAMEAERQTKRAEQVKEFLIGIFEASSPEEWRGKEPTAKDLLEIGAQRLEKELASDPLMRAQMQRVIGEIAISRGDLDSAQALLEQAIVEVRRLTGEDSKDYADALHTWADLLFSKGDNAEATSAVEREVEIRRRKFPNHWDTAQALGLLANLRLAAGRLDEAIALRKEAAGLVRRTRGVMNRHYVAHVVEIGQLLLLARRIDEARPLLDEALVISRKLYGPDSAMFAVALNSQARMMSESGELERASIAYGDAADIFRRAKSNQQLVQALNNQGDALCRMGRFADGERSYREALQVAQTLASPSQVRTLKRNFGKCLSDAGRFSKAEPLLRETADVAREDEAPNRNDVLAGASHMLRLLVRQGRAAEAVAVVGQTEARLGPIKGAESLNAAVFQVLAAPAWFMAGDQARGLAMLREALEDLRKAGAPKSLIGAASIDLAALELQSGRAREAEAHLRGVENALDGGSQGPQGLRARMLRGVALMQMRRLGEAERLLRSALNARRRMYGDDNAWTGEARLYLGICLHRAGKLEEGRALLRLARAQFTRESGATQFVTRMADEELR